MATFLIIDDSKVVRNILKKILEDAGHKVVAEASDGLEGETMYFEHKPDIVTLDNVMPGKNGKECLENIIAKDPDAKIIMQSAVGKEKTISEEIIIGAKCFIKKPFEEENVLAAVDSILKSKY